MKLSIIMPAFNEEKQIRQSLDLVQKALEDFEDGYEIIVVSDGSTDNTSKEAKNNSCSHVRVYHYPKNQGKGYALKYGSARSTGEYVAFIDADMELHPKSIVYFIDLLEQNSFDIIVGSKRHPESVVDYPPLRRFYSWTYQQLNRILFNVNVRDTQVGLKMFRREVLENVLPCVLVKAYAFDLELLVVAQHLGFNRIDEAPVELSYGFDSSIDFKGVWRMLVDTLAIFYRLRILKYYTQQYQNHKNQSAAFSCEDPDLSLEYPPK